MKNAVFEGIIIGVVFVSFLIYHIYLAIRIRVDPNSTVIGQNHRIRRLWCEVIRKKSDLLILGVQTIRNVIMSASILASSTIALNAATFVFLLNYENIPGIKDLNVLGSNSIKPGHKLLALTISFLLAFFNFIQSIRLNSHASFQISLPVDTNPDPYLVAIVDTLNSGANFFTIGTRCYFLAFLIILWLFGPIPPLALLLLMIPTFYYLDIHIAKSRRNLVDRTKLIP